MQQCHKMSRSWFNSFGESVDNDYEILYSNKSRKYTIKTKTKRTWKLFFEKLMDVITEELPPRVFDPQCVV